MILLVIMTLSHAPSTISAHGYAVLTISVTKIIDLFTNKPFDDNFRN